MALEIELKLALAARDVPRLRRQDLLKAVRPQHARLYTLYFDTPEFDLYRRGAAFRLRRLGYHWLQTVKVAARSTGTLSSRPEWEVQVTGNRPDLAILPAEARRHVEDVADRLVPCFETEFRRTTWQLADARGSVEVALDQGEVRAGDRALPISELEFELKGGDSALLFEAAQTLLAAVPLGLEPRSKALRGYTLAGAHRLEPCKAVSPDIAKGLPAAEAYRRMLAAALAQFAANIPGFLAATEDPEYVHQLRVAVRRLRAVLGLGRQIGVAPPAWRDDFKWLMGELSPARDWDVLVTETLPRVQAGLARPEDLAAIAAAAEAERAKANARVRQVLLSRRLVTAVLAAEASLLGDHDQGASIGEWARQALDRRYRQFRRAGKGFAGLGPAERHRLRIAAKRLRYSGEGFIPVYGARAERYLARISELQDGLGTANDMAVAHGLLAALSGDADPAYAAGLVEGFLACEAGQRAQGLDKAVRATLAAKPFWR